LKEIGAIKGNVGHKMKIQAMAVIVCDYFDNINEL